MERVALPEVLCRMWHSSGHTVTLSVTTKSEPAFLKWRTFYYKNLASV